MKQYKIGYTQGVFDMFHIGHLNLLRRAKEQCETLIVGVNTDELVKNYKHKYPVVHEDERLEIIKSIRFVDKALLTDTLDKVGICTKLHFDAIFIGSDWRGNARWEKTEEDLKSLGNIDVVYIDYTQRISSTILRLQKENRVIDGVNMDLSAEK